MLSLYVHAKSHVLISNSVRCSSSIYLGPLRRTYFSLIGVRARIYLGSCLILLRLRASGFGYTLWWRVSCYLEPFSLVGRWNCWFLRISVEIRYSHSIFVRSNFKGIACLLSCCIYEYNWIFQHRATEVWKVRKVYHILW